MRLGSDVRFPGDLGKHNDTNGQPCAGRDFEPTVVGVGGSLHQRGSMLEVRQGTRRIRGPAGCPTFPPEV